MKTKHIGLLVLVLMIAGIVAYSLVVKPKMEVTAIDGYLGGEKIGLFEDPEFAKIMRKNGLEVTYSKAGSLDMVTADKTNRNYLFPSSQTALDFYIRENGTPKQSEIIFNTPIVLYTWAMVSDALVKEGIVKDINGVLTVDMQEIAKLIENDTTWADLGLTQLYGNMTIQTTHPAKSNSGNMFSGLMANSLNNGQVVNEQSVVQILPRLRKIYDKIGYMESSSSDLFSQFLKTGVGAKPMIVGYESQLLEFSKEYPESFEKVKDKIKIIYPTPTVWSSHIYIALDDNGKRATPVLLSQEMQKLAWEKHGFRTGVSGAQQDTNLFGVSGLEDEVTSIIPMPDSKTMEKIVNTLE